MKKSKNASELDFRLFILEKKSFIFIIFTIYCLFGTASVGRGLFTLEVTLLARCLPGYLYAYVVVGNTLESSSSVSHETL